MSETYIWFKNPICLNCTVYRFKIETSHAVIPAQAGIQTFGFQKCLKIAVMPNFWIPACAGMTAWVLNLIV